jgi:methyltransferase (TIGR00027 family)
MRATDRRRAPSERILDDPYAKLFLGPMMRAALASWEATGALGRMAERLSPGLTTFVMTRHRYIDDRLRAALAREADPVAQVVLLGAGYDSRGYRFADELRGRPVFEVDFPATSRRKAKIVAHEADALPAVATVRVEIDFQTQSLADRLVESGFQGGARSFFVWEGVSMYLTRDAVKTTLSTLRQLGGPGSELAMDFWYYLDEPSLFATAYRASANVLSLIGEPVTFGIHPEDVESFLDRLGLRLLDVADAAALEARYVTDGRRVAPGIYLVHAKTA